MKKTTVYLLSLIRSMHVCSVTLLMHRLMRCRVFCSGGRMLCVEEMVLCGLSCSMFVSRLCAMGTSLVPLLSSVEMYRLSFSLRSTLFMPPFFFGGSLAAGGRAFSQASVASRNSTALLGSSILTKITCLSSIMKSLCGDRHNALHCGTFSFDHTLWRTTCCASCVWACAMSWDTGTASTTASATSAAGFLFTLLCK